MNRERNRNVSFQVSVWCFGAFAANSMEVSSAQWTTDDIHHLLRECTHYLVRNTREYDDVFALFADLSLNLHEHFSDSVVFSLDGRTLSAMSIETLDNAEVWVEMGGGRNEDEGEVGEAESSPYRVRLGESSSPDCLNQYVERVMERISSRRA